MTPPVTDEAAALAQERLKVLHATICQVAAGLNFDLRRMTIFGDNYNQAVVDGLGRLDAICDTLADIALTAYANRPTPPVSRDAGVLVDALTACRHQFVEYEHQHRAKGTFEADAKAETNASMARLCEKALAAYSRRSDGGEEVTPPFEIGCRVGLGGPATLQGELLEFNEPVTGALIRWDNGEEIWKALRNLEVIAPPPAPEVGEEA